MLEIYLIAIETIALFVLIIFNINQYYTNKRTLENMEKQINVFKEDLKEAKERNRILKEKLTELTQAILQTSTSDKPFDPLKEREIKLKENQFGWQQLKDIFTFLSELPDEDE